MLALGDTVKQEAHLVIWLMRRQLGLNVVLMTGDNRLAATYVGRMLGIHKDKVSFLPVSITTLTKFNLLRFFDYVYSLLYN